MRLLSVWICVSDLQDLSCYGFIEVFKSQLLTETFRGSAQARPKQALHDTSDYCFDNFTHHHQRVRPFAPELFQMYPYPVEAHLRAFGNTLYLVQFWLAASQ